MIEPRSHIPILNIPKPKKPKSRLTRGGGIRPVSAKRAKLNKIYSALRKTFLAKHPFCQIWIKENADEGYELSEEFIIKNNGIIRQHSIYSLCPRSQDVHHKKGRGKYLLDVSTWLAVSRLMHEKVHREPKWAREKGYLI